MTCRVRSATHSPSRTSPPPRGTTVQLPCVFPLLSWLRQCLSLRSSAGTTRCCRLSSSPKTSRCFSFVYTQLSFHFLSSAFHCLLHRRYSPQELLPEVEAFTIEELIPVRSAAFSLSFHRTFMDLPWTFHCLFLDLSLSFHCFSIDLSCTCHGPFTAFSLTFHCPFTVFPSNFHAPVMDLPWTFHCLFLDLSLSFHCLFLAGSLLCMRCCG